MLPNKLNTHRFTQQYTSVSKRRNHMAISYQIVLVILDNDVPRALLLHIS